MARVPPIRQLSSPIVIPQSPKIAAILPKEAPIDCKMAISFFLSFTKRTRREITLQQATRRIIAAIKRKRVLSL